MLIDLYKPTNIMEIDEIKFVNSYFGKLFKQFFLLKGFSANCYFAKKDDITFDYSYHSPGFHIQANEISSKKIIYPMRYYNYPSIDDDFGSITWAPNQGWMLGFAEKLLLTLDRSILKIIEDGGTDYITLTTDSTEKFKTNMNMQWDPKGIAARIELIKENNKSKNMSPKYMSFERSTLKEIREDIQNLLSQL